MDAGFKDIRTYRYWDAAKRGLDLQGLLDDMEVSKIGMGWDELSLVHGSQQLVELWKCIPAEKTAGARAARSLSLCCECFDVVLHMTETCSLPRKPQSSPFSSSMPVHTTQRAQTLLQTSGSRSLLL